MTKTMLYILSLALLTSDIEHTQDLTCGNVASFYQFKECCDADVSKKIDTSNCVPPTQIIYDYLRDDIIPDAVRQNRAVSHRPNWSVVQQQFNENPTWPIWLTPGASYFRECLTSLFNPADNQLATVPDWQMNQQRYSNIGKSLLSRPMFTSFAAVLAPY